MRRSASSPARRSTSGLIRARVGRLSIVGELGYEIHCLANEHATLRNILLEAGAGLDAVEYGFNAVGSLRLEKSFGIWSREFTQDYTAGMTGMGQWIAFDKADFIGRDAALKERDSGGARRILATLEVDAADADASGYEPVWRKGKRVGFVTSGGYGHTIDKSVAMVLIDRELAGVGTDLTVHVVGVERGARVIARSPYDPAGTRMRC